MVLILWNRVFMRPEDKPIGLIQITCPLTFSILRQLMVMTRHIPNVFKSVSSFKIGNPSKKQVGTQLTHLLLAFTLI